jgi:hypothetical protein
MEFTILVQALLPWLTSILCVPCFSSPRTRLRILTELSRNRFKVSIFFTLDPNPSNVSDTHSEFVAACLVKEMDQRPTAKELLNHR